MLTQPDLELSRRRFVLGALTAAAVGPTVGRAHWAGATEPSYPIAIGSRRELFVDDALVERLDGKAELRLHHPRPQGVVLVHDAPWEGSGSGYHSVFRDGGLYRMYYKAWHLEVSAKRL